jgi:hypothetical protein
MPFSFRRAPKPEPIEQQPPVNLRTAAGDDYLLTTTELLLTKQGEKLVAIHRQLMAERNNGRGPLETHALFPPYSKDARELDEYLSRFKELDLIQENQNDSYVDIEFTEPGRLLAEHLEAHGTANFPEIVLHPRYRGNDPVPVKIKWAGY